MVEQESSLSLTLIKDFQTLEDQSKIKILNALNDFLQKDNDLLFKAVHKQVTSYVSKALQLYEGNMLKELIELLTNLSPLAVIILNIEISLTNNKYTEEGNTLSQTLLPFVNIWYDYSFIQPKDHFIMTRFLHSLIRHIQDTNLEVKKGFFLFAIALDAQKVQDISGIQKNKQPLKASLLHLGYSQKVCQIFADHIQQLFWPDVFYYLKGKDDQTVLDIVSILSKLIIQSDPGSNLRKLNDIFAQRRILIDLLLPFHRIDITIEVLITVLENLKLLNVNSIKKCIDNDSKQWFRISQLTMNQETVLENQVPEEKLHQLYNDHIYNKEKSVSMNDMNQISEQIEKQCNFYNHNVYQSTIASIIASCQENIILVVVPTGSGKTWIQALLAKYYCINKQRVNIVEPNQILQLQTAEKIGAVDYRITISTTDWLYQYFYKDDIIILDEYDEIVTNQAFAIVNNNLTGIWNIKGKKLIAFTATSNSALEKYVNNIIGQPKVLKFPSQYELIYGVSHLSLGNIVCSQKDHERFLLFKQDVLKYYEKKPLIIIIDDDQEKETLFFIKQEKLKFVIGSNENNLQDIRTWEYGILILKSYEARGLDTRFAQDGIVLIIAKLDNELQYQQYIGRSSRSMGVSEGVLYTGICDNPNQVIQMLKRQNFIYYQELEYLVKLFQKRHNNQTLIEAIMKSNKLHKQSITVDNLKTIIGDKTFQQLIKGLYF